MTPDYPLKWCAYCKTHHPDVPSFYRRIKRRRGLEISKICRIEERHRKRLSDARVRQEKARRATPEKLVALCQSGRWV